MRLALIQGRITVRAANGPALPYERYLITVNPDGSRTLRTLTVSPQGSLVRDVNQNVTKDWRPTSGASRLYLDGEPCGVIAKFATEQGIRSVVYQKGAVDIAEFEAPKSRYTLGFHPIGDESWKMALVPLETGKRHPLATHTCSVTWNGKTIGHGELLESEVEYVGLEKKTIGGVDHECRAFLWFTPFGKVLKIWALGEHYAFAGLEVLEGDNAGTVYELVSLEHENF